LAKPGYLIIHGGGSTAPETTRALIARAGGPDKLILVLPQTSEDAAAKSKGSIDWLKQNGAKNVAAPLVTKSGDTAGISEALALLEKASGVWIPGGNQNRLMELFAKTPVPDAIRAVYRRGGAVGGTSAGASLMGDFMPTGTGDMEKLTYDVIETAPGLGLLPGIVVDSHFLVRQRPQRLLDMCLSHPERTGIGIDEKGLGGDRRRGRKTDGPGRAGGGGAGAVTGSPGQPGPPGSSRDSSVCSAALRQHRACRDGEKRTVEMTRRDLLQRAALLGACVLPTSAEFAQAAETPAVTLGKGRFSYTDPLVNPGKTLTVWYYLPVDKKADKVPILFVMHGTLRNGETYRNQWVDLAQKYGVLLLVPEFSSADYPGGKYNRGNVLGKDDEALQPPETWTFAVLERLFDYAKKITGTAQSSTIFTDTPRRAVCPPSRPVPAASALSTCGRRERRVLHAPHGHRPGPLSVQPDGHSGDCGNTENRSRARTGHPAGRRGHRSEGPGPLPLAGSR
jgi:cyanophycinase